MHAGGHFHGGKFPGPVPSPMQSHFLLHGQIIRTSQTCCNLDGSPAMLAYCKEIGRLEYMYKWPFFNGNDIMIINVWWKKQYLCVHEIYYYILIIMIYMIQYALSGLSYPSSGTLLAKLVDSSCSPRPPKNASVPIGQTSWQHQHSPRRGRLIGHVMQIRAHIRQWHTEPYIVEWGSVPSNPSISKLKHYKTEFWKLVLRIA